MMQRKKITALLVCIFLLVFCFADESSRFEHLTIKDGLSQSTIKSIFQDSRGFLWFGSGDGLNRYDGYNLIVYRNDPSDPKSLSGNDISCIYENPMDSSLWICTESLGLNVYDRKKDNFVSFKHNSRQKNSLPANNIRNMLAGTDGKLWLGTMGGGLCSFNPVDSTFLKPAFSELPRFRNVHSLANYKNSGLWLGTSSGLYRWDFSGRGNPVAIDLGLTSPAIIRGLRCDLKGNLWIGTHNQGLIKYQPETRRVTHYFPGSTTLNSIGSFSIYNIIQRKDGAIWIATENGLYRYTPQSDDFESFTNDLDDPESIGDDVIYCLFEDKSDIFWIGTFLGGVNKLNPEDSGFRKFNNYFKSGMTNKRINNVKGIYRDGKNAVWVATSRGLVLLKEAYFNNHKKLGEVELYFKDVDLDNIFGDGQQNIYVSNFQGIFVLKKGSSQFQKFAPGNLSSYPQLKQFNSGFEDSERMIWLATSFGLLKYDPVKNWVTLKNPTDANGSEIQENILSVTEASDGKLWMGTLLGVLYVYDRNTDQFEKILPNESVQDKSTFIRIFSVCEQSSGIIWFGTNNGLYEYLVKDRKLNRFMNGDGLSNNVVYSVIPDAKGRIWCSTNLGISVFQTSTRTFLNYSWEDGLQSNEFNQGAWYRAPDGKIYMGGIDGFNVIDPERINPNPFIPPVVITGLTVNHRRITPNSDPEIIAHQISELKELTLSHDQSIFTFEFTALNYILSGKNQYRYKLEGYDKHWVEAGSLRTASYTNIDPGTYTFMVEGSNNDRVWNEKPTILQIRILPPFWLTWWFKLLLFLFVLLVIYLAFYFRLKTITLERERLGKLVEEKTAALSEKNMQIEKQNKDLIHINEEVSSRNEKIGQKNKKLKEQNEQIVKQRDNLLALAEQVQQANQAKINFFTTISHEFRTPLTLIIGPLKELIMHIDDLNKNELYRKFKIIYGNASKLLLLVNELLEFRKADTDNLGLELTRFDLVPYVQQITFLFNDIAQRKMINFRFISSPKTLDVWADAEKLEKIITNLISNAFKFTPEHGDITVSLDFISGKNDDGQFQIIVSDSGMGISEDHIGYVFDTFYQADHTENLQQSGSGLGLALVKKYVELHGGTVSVNSKPGKGTSFMLTIPILEAEEHTITSSLEYSQKMISNRDVLIASIDDYTPNLLQNLKTGEEQNLPKLLLVEDDQNLRAYLKEILLVNYRVEEAGDVTTGLNLTNSKHPDLIICDVMLPDATGFDFCRKVKDEFKTSHIPVILLTALADLPNQMNALKSGADAYITKPFDLQHLYLTIENLINQRRKLQSKYYRGIELDNNDPIHNKEDQQFLNRVIAEIEKNITDASFDVDRLCKEINLSQPQTYRKIKALTDLSISEFIRNIRLKKAAQLLASRNQTISEVAYEVGFSDPNYFSKCFVKVYGQTPSDFIKMKN